MSKYTHIIWDWNGTLLDDVGWCIESMNRMLNKRSMKTLEDVSEYHKAFCFPIIEYYKNVGFDFEIEPFDLLAKEYIAIYHGEGIESCRLHQNAENVLKTFHESGVSQIILSATEMQNLKTQTGYFNISHYFDEILGTQDIYAKSKIEIGMDYMSRTKMDNAVLIGDTLHDYEVSQELGIDCVLIANGHQDKESLIACGVRVISDIQDAPQYVLPDLQKSNILTSL